MPLGAGVGGGSCRLDEDRGTAGGGGPETISAAASWLSGLDLADDAERRAILSAYVDRVIRGVLLVPGPEPISAQQSLLDFGLDSMSATNLRNRLASDTGVELPLHMLLSGAAREQLADVLSLRLGHRLALSRMTASAPPGSDDGDAIEEFVL